MVTNGRQALRLVQMEKKCPICSGARVIAGINDLATLEPLLGKAVVEKE